MQKTHYVYKLHTAYMIGQFIIIKKHGNKTSDKAGCADRLGRKQTIKTKFKTGDGYFCTLHAYLVFKKKVGLLIILWRFKKNVITPTAVPMKTTSYFVNMNFIVMILHKIASKTLPTPTIK